MVYLVILRSSAASGSGRSPTVSTDASLFCSGNSTDGAQGTDIKHCLADILQAELRESQSNKQNTSVPKVHLTAAHVPLCKNVFENKSGLTEHGEHCASQVMSE